MSKLSKKKKIIGKKTIIFFILCYIMYMIGLARRICMKKTKIICSVGPACDRVDVMEKLVRSGMNCARINLSHASRESI